MMRMIWSVLCVLLVGGMMAPTLLMADSLTPRQLYAYAAPGTVFILSTSHVPGDGEMGTGIVVDPSGLVLTNAHVVMDERSGHPYAMVEVMLKPAHLSGVPAQDLTQRFSATIEHVDSTLDLAVLQVQSGVSFPVVLALGNSDQAGIGEAVVAIGHPEKGGLWTLTTGVISSTFDAYGGVEGKHVFQTETSLNRGNSGGPLLNPSGHVVGINTAVARVADDGMPITDISFAIKSNVARHWLASNQIVLPEAPQIDAGTIVVGRRLAGGMAPALPVARPFAISTLMRTLQPSLDPEAPAWVTHQAVSSGGLLSAVGKGLATVGTGLAITEKAIVSADEAATGNLWGLLWRTVGTLLFPEYTRDGRASIWATGPVSSLRTTMGTSGLVGRKVTDASQVSLEQAQAQVQSIVDEVMVQVKINAEWVSTDGKTAYSRAQVAMADVRAVIQRHQPERIWTSGTASVGEPMLTADQTGEVRERASDAFGDLERELDPNASSTPPIPGPPGLLPEAVGEGESVGRKPFKLPKQRATTPTQAQIKRWQKKLKEAEAKGDLEAIERLKEKLAGTYQGSVLQQQRKKVKKRPFTPNTRVPMLPKGAFKKPPQFPHLRSVMPMSSDPTQCINSKMASFSLDACFAACSAKYAQLGSTSTANCKVVCSEAHKKREELTRKQCRNDNDGDGISNQIDQCPNTKIGMRVNWVGCADSDGDSIADNQDKCPRTPRGTPVNLHGCDLRTQCEEGNNCGDPEPRCSTPHECARLLEIPLPPDETPASIRKVLAKKFLSRRAHDINCPNDHEPPPQPQLFTPEAHVVSQEVGAVTVTLDNGVVVNGPTVPLALEWEAVEDSCAPVTYSVYIESYHCHTLGDLIEPHSYHNRGWCQWMPYSYESIPQDQNPQTQLNVELPLGKIFYESHVPFIPELGWDENFTGDFSINYQPAWFRVQILAHDGNGLTSASLGPHTDAHYFVFYGNPLFISPNKLTEIPVAP